MKVFIFAALFTTLDFTTKAQWFDFSNNNEHATAAVTVGQAGFGTEYAGIGVGGSISIRGFYVDCLIDGPDHQYDNHVSQDYDNQ